MAISKSFSVGNKPNEIVSVADFGAVGDGVTDDTSAFTAALATTPSILYVPKGTYKFDSSVIVSNPVWVLAAPGAKILGSLGLSGGKVLALESDDIIITGLEVYSTGETFSPATGNTYAFFSGDGTTTYKNHTFRNCKVTDLGFTDGNAISSDTNLLVSHAFYVDKVDNVKIEDCHVDTVTGAALFAKVCRGLSVRDCHFLDNKWYTINLDHSVYNFKIDNCKFDSNDADGVYWGGAINIVSAIGENQVQHGEITNNYFTGKYSYGAVLRLQSAKDVLVQHNEFEGITIGTAADGDLTAIRVLTRGTDASNKNNPAQDISILDNTLHGPTGVTGRQRGIFVDNDYWSTRVPAKNIYIERNKLYSADTSNYWDEGISVHGQDGGIDNVWVEDNYVQTYLQTSPAVGGAIGFIANDADGSVKGVNIGGNTIVDIGTPASSYQYGIGINAYVDEVTNTKPNEIDNYFYGIRTLANSGPTLEYIDDQRWGTNSTDELFVVAISRSHRNMLILDDGTTAPSATSGVAKLYVDAADGDLKIKFGDGTTKTIATDS